MKSNIPKLWCIHLTPIRKRDEQKIKDALSFLARGPGKTEIERLMWVASAMCGIEDYREEKWATHHRKIIAFTNLKDAVAESKKHENEYWHASVQELCIR